MPAHPDVPAGLKQLKDAGFRLVTLSNSPQGAQIIQLTHAGIDGYFERLLSVDLVRRYKPAPQVYHMAAEELYASTAEICMVSTHVWDILGAQNVKNLAKGEAFLARRIEARQLDRDRLP